MLDIRKGKVGYDVLVNGVEVAWALAWDVAVALGEVAMTKSRRH